MGQIGIKCTRQSRLYVKNWDKRIVKSYKCTNVHCSMYSSTRQIGIYTSNWGSILLGCARLIGLRAPNWDISTLLGCARLIGL